MKTILGGIACWMIILAACQSNKSANQSTEVIINSDTLTINLQVTGTLGSYLELSDSTINHLNIIGDLNGNDMLALRDYLCKQGTIQLSLDLSKSCVVEGGDAYYIGKGDTLYTQENCIGDYQFYGCTRLKNIVLPSNTLSIGCSAFESCHSLESITMPDGITNLGEYAFFDCKSLKEIHLSENISRIHKCTFMGCKSLQSITIPSETTAIENYAFMGCESLNNIELPQGISKIGEFAFFQSPIETIYSRAQYPPTLSRHSFNAPNATLYIPKGSYNTYSDTQWGKILSRIIETEK
ncbi:MAG: leucine-rich repeat domain-containing protein [Bacteroides sp.]|nr:leucine-rich repeat domain-containing protein [Bacteroides sp.]